MYALQASRGSPLLSSVLIHGLGCECGASGDLGGAVHGLKTTKQAYWGGRAVEDMTLEGGIKEQGNILLTWKLFYYGKS